MKTIGLVLAVALLSASMSADAAKRLKPKYYKECYDGYKEMRELVPKPPVDVQKTAQTVSAVAGIAGRFGGFGGLGSAASTAATVAQYSETIADVAAFTQSMSDSFPMSSDRFRAYGERMKTEATDMAKVSSFAAASQECYAQAYVDLKKGAEAGEFKKREVKKRHKEINTGVANISEMLEHAAMYMDTNIDAYNQAMNQETSGAGLDLGNLLSLASQGAAVAGQVNAISGTSSIGSGYTGSVHAEAHRQAMKLHYEAAGLPNPHPAPELPSTGYFGGMSSLTTLASIGSIDPGMGAAMAAQMAVGEANLAAAGYEKPQLPAAMQEAQPSTDDNIAALIAAGADVQPYLDAYNEIKGLSDIQRSVAGFVNNPI